MFVVWYCSKMLNRKSLKNYEQHLQLIEDRPANQKLTIFPKCSYRRQQKSQQHNVFII